MEMIAIIILGVVFIGSLAYASYLSGLDHNQKEE